MAAGARAAGTRANGGRHPERRHEVVDLDCHAHPACLERAPAAALLERGDPALPAAGSAASPIAHLPGTRLRGLDRGWRGILVRGESLGDGLGAGQRGVQRRGRDGLALQRPARRRELGAQVGDHLVGLLARRPDVLVALPTGASPLLLRGP